MPFEHNEYRELIYYQQYSRLGWVEKDNKDEHKIASTLKKLSDIPSPI